MNTAISNVVKVSTKRTLMPKYDAKGIQTLLNSDRNQECIETLSRYSYQGKEGSFGMSSREIARKNKAQRDSFSPALPKFERLGGVIREDIKRFDAATGRSQDVFHVRQKGEALKEINVSSKIRMRRFLHWMGLNAPKDPVEFQKAVRMMAEHLLPELKPCEHCMAGEKRLGYKKGYHIIDGEEARCKTRWEDLEQ